MKNLKYGLYAVLAVYVLYSIFFSSSSEDSVTYEEVQVPTEGLITTVQEVDTNLFKISDEQPVPTPEDSRIIANYMDNTSDTFTLEEAKLVEAEGQSDNNYRRSGIVRAATYGFFGYMMGRSMGSRPSANAYVDPKTHNRVSSTTGSRVTSTARTVSRPTTGKSGYGGSRSTRSYGG
jgi:hypothetical protein